MSKHDDNFNLFLSEPIDQDRRQDEEAPFEVASSKVRRRLARARARQEANDKARRDSK